MLAFIFSAILSLNADNPSNEIVESDVIKKEQVSIGKRLMKKRRKL